MMGVGNIVCSEVRFTHFCGVNDVFIPRQMEFKGWVA